MKAVELFAGPGGMSEGIRMARPDAKVVGVEWDEDACLIARAAGHHRLQGDVAALDPAVYADADYLHASPPCQGFSMAGKGKGREDGERLLTAIDLIGRHPQQVEEIMAAFDARASDHRSVLTLEVLRWVVRMGYPRFVSLEQVPTVLPLWEAVAAALESWGYAVWAGVLNAEQYGVPQTRKRAILMAERGASAVEPPVPTHSRYYPRDRARLDEGVLPWVSMAQALGWSEGIVVRSNYGTGGDPAARGERAGGEPAATVTSEAGRNVVLLRNGTAENACVRGADEPAGTMFFGQRLNKVTWETRFREAVAAEVGPRVNNQFEAVGNAVPPLLAAAVVAGRDLVGMPGANANRFNGSTKSRNDGIRITAQEAGILQSFRADYPWGAARTKSKQFEAVGNAVPPLLAAAVVAALTRGA